MSRYFDSLVWIDADAARVFQVSAAATARIAVHADRVHDPRNHNYFRRIAGTIRFTDGTFIAGPGRVKFDLKDYLDLHDPDVAARICRVEAIPEWRDDELAALARRYFHHRAQATSPDRHPTLRDVTSLPV